MPLILTRPGCSEQRGQRLCLLPVSAGRDPSLPSTPARVKHTHPSQPLPCPALPRGIQQCFAAIFHFPLVAVSQGRLCSSTSGTSWRLGRNEQLAIENIRKSNRVGSPFCRPHWCCSTGDWAWSRDHFLSPTDETPTSKHTYGQFRMFN